MSDRDRDASHCSRSPNGREPIAIIGIGCRFPGGAGSPEAFWQLLCEGKDAITEIPADRWNIDRFFDPDPEALGKTNSRWGGFIEDLDGFDANFFRISPREAVGMDPQQRHLLEVAWEALEDAGQDLRRLKGSEAGVFIGMSSLDYAFLEQGRADLTRIDTYANTGGAMSIAANRVSYCLDFRGPSMSIDSACSSALVAVHLACESLWDRGCPLALAGGVNVLIKPEPFIGFSQLHMLAPDGRCKAFDASADGFVRGEGVGIVVLKRYQDAKRDGDRIYAVVRGTAVNQDGRTSGLTVPSQASQEALIRQACAAADVTPSEVQFVEAHGTGTLVGDPIEVRALGNVFSPGRPDGRRLAIGSVKTNIGHLEPAAGIAGLIKVALALKHRMLPANLNFREGNPNIPFDDLKVTVQQQLEPWPTVNGTALAGVNSFGFGGTNAHAVLEAIPEWAPVAGNGNGTAGGRNGELPLPNPLTAPAPANAETESSGDPVQLVPVSARSPKALAALAGRYADCVQGDTEGVDVNLPTFAHSAAVRRTHHDYRLAVLARTREELAEKLRTYSQTGKLEAAMTSGRVMSGRDTKIAFVFSGQGPQWWAMGRELLGCEPVFRETIEQCDELVRRFGAWSLLEELLRDEAASRMDDTAIAQPAIFAIQVALARLWQSWGIEPEAVTGHSVGEVAAAYVAGILSLEDATYTIYQRGRLMGLADTTGKMLAAGLSPEQARGLIEGKDELVSVAAVNGPKSVTLSGSGEELERIAELLEERDIFNRFLKVNYAFHSPHMDPVREPLIERLAAIHPGQAALPFYSTATGQALDGWELGAEYWWRNVRRTVMFAEAVGGLLREGCNTFLEIAPHPVLSSSISQVVREAGEGEKVSVLHSLRRKTDERASMLGNAAALYTSGAPIAWDGLLRGTGQFVPLPLYPWQHEPYWHESEESKHYRTGPAPHPLLGERLESAAPTWQNRVDLRWLKYLGDHRVEGQALLPAASYVELAISAARALHGPGQYVVEDLEFKKACFLPDDEGVSVQVALGAHDSTVTISGRPWDGDRPWTEHARGKVRQHEDTDDPKPIDREEIRGRCPTRLSAEECYQRLARLGLDYGPAFRGIQEIWSGCGEAIGRIEVPEAVGRDADAYFIHPAILDACFQAGFVALPPGREGVYLPIEVATIRVYGRLRGTLWGYVHDVRWQGKDLVADMAVIDESGRRLMDIRGFRARRVDSHRDTDRSASLNDISYRYHWQVKPRPHATRKRRTAAFLPSPTRLLKATTVEAERLDAALGLIAKNKELEAKLNPLCAAFILNAFDRLGLGLRVGLQFSDEALLEQLEIAPQHHRLLGRYLQILVEEGILTPDASRREVRHLPAYRDVEAQWQALQRQSPAYYAELTLLGRCGRRLAEILRGEVDPLHLIFPDGSLAITDHLYQDSPFLRYYNLLSQHAVARMFTDLPQGRTIRVLEIGAGTGGLTSYVLPKLPAAQTEYVFTDLSNHFFQRAEQKLRDYPFVEYQRLDVEADPGEQGFDRHSFDIILASEVLHATIDLRRTMENVKSLLASEGLILLLEGSRPLRWVDLIFGLTEGWWRFSDRDLRPSSPLLSFAEWRALLESLDFSDVHEASGREGVDNAVILARGPCVSEDAPVDEKPPAAPEAVEEAAQPAQAETAESESRACGRWLVFADRHGKGLKLAESLRSRGDSCVIVHRGDDFRRIDEHQFAVSPAEPDHVKQVLREVFGGNGRAATGIVHLWNLDLPTPDQADHQALEESMLIGNLSVVRLLQALGETDLAEPPRLWLVTQGAQSVGGRPEATSALQAGAWGLCRVIVNEMPMFRPTVVDLSLEAPGEEIESLCDELRFDDREDEIALRGDGRFVHRFVRTEDDEHLADSGSVAEDATEPFRLEASPSGTLEKLAFRAAPRRAPGPGEVEIEVVAAALNFSDVMKALGIYPGLTDETPPLGIECSGRVVRVGEGVGNMRPGDAVVAVAPQSFAAYVTTPARFVVRKPAHVGFEEAATIPIAFLTADYALNCLGHLSPGERVLIHSATGGVGLAAIQLAEAAGAEIFATAGTPEKRELLHSLGIRHVMDSRSLAFADQILEATGGEGVDVVLNSLAGAGAGAVGAVYPDRAGARGRDAGTLERVGGGRRAEPGVAAVRRPHPCQRPRHRVGRQAEHGGRAFAE